MDELAWFESTYNQHADFCFRLGRHFLPAGEGDDALYDVVQEVFIALWEKRAELMNHPNIGGWLSLAIRYRVMNHIHRAKRRAQRHAYSMDEPETPSLAAVQLTPEEKIELEGKLDALRELLGEENAAMFIAYAVQGYRAKELGVRFGIGENCVHVRISRMKKKLAAHPELFYVLLLASIGALRL